MKRTALLAALLASTLAAPAAHSEAIDYRLIATSATGRLERELNQAASEGYRFARMHAGETAFGGRELVAGVELGAEDAGWHRFDYAVLAASSTGTLRRELREIAAMGFRLVGQTVFQTEFGGAEVIAVMERDINAEERWDYELLATNRTSTMERELREAARRGFVLCGLSVGVTAFGGPEVVAFLERPAGSRAE